MALKLIIPREILAFLVETCVALTGSCSSSYDSVMRLTPLGELLGQALACPKCTFCLLLLPVELNTLACLVVVTRTLVVFCQRFLQ